MKKLEEKVELYVEIPTTLDIHLISLTLKYYLEKQNFVKMLHATS